MNGERKIFTRLFRLQTDGPEAACSSPFLPLQGSSTLAMWSTGC